MCSLRSWTRFFPLLVCVALALIGCGGATGLPRGNEGSKGLGGEAGAAGASEAAAGESEVGAGGEPGSTGAAGEANAAGQGQGGEASATLIAVAVTPAVASAAVGTRVVLQAVGTYSDSSTRDVSAEATWTSSDDRVARVMGGTVTARAAGNTTITASLTGFSGTASITVPAATITGLTVTPASATIGVQGSAAFHAVVTLSDGTTQDVTATATWTSSDAKIASVSADGTALGVGVGSVTISAAVGRVSGTAKLAVTSATLVSIAVTPTNPTLGVGVSQTFVATGTFSDGSVSDVSASATFSSSAGAIASVSAGNVVTTVKAGTTTITASIGAISGSTNLTVTGAALTSISVSPATATLAVKGTLGFTATGSYADGTMADITESVLWASSSTKAAAVSNAAGSRGSVTGIAAGMANITATLDGVTGTATVKVTAAPLVSIAIAPQNPSLPLGTTQPFSATGTYADGSVVDISSQVTWSSSTASVASIDNAQGRAGTATALALGSTAIHAKLSGIDGQTTLTVTAARLVSISLSPADPSVPAGTGVALTATANYSDGSHVDVTASAVWTSSTATVASVSNAAGSQGQVTAIAEGTSTITARYSDVSGTTVVTVAAPTLTQVVVSPIASSIRVGGNVNYVATAIYSNNTQRRITTGVTWSSSDTAVATLMNAGGPGMGMGGARATGVAAGTTVISATYQGVQGSTPLTVTDATVVSIEVTPIDPTITVNGTQQLVATAIYDDNTTADVTARATWVSSNTGVAQVTTAGGGGPGGGGRGRVTGVAAGTATITATVDGLTGSTDVTVSAATLVSIDITPAAPSVASGTRFNFTATAIYSDNTSRNVTGQATWVSSDPSVASISTAGGGGGGRGQAVALAVGTTTISASIGSVTGQTTLTVTDATLVSIEITPFSPTLPVGFNTSLVATGIYSDNTTRDLTGQATWTTSASAVAAVSNAAGSRGLLTPLTAGSATITATYQGVSGTDDVTVSAATLTGITVTPATATVGVHADQAFTALGTLSDKTSLDITAYVTWLSTTASVASISNAAASRGVATGLSAGTVTISAVRGSVVGTAQLTVQ